MGSQGYLSNIVVVALLERGGKVFIAKRAATKLTWPNRYELIGGHVDPGETLEAALIREIDEEIHVTVDVDRIIDAFTFESENNFKVEICYLCHLPSNQEPRLNSVDHSEAKWINKSEISLFEKEDQETEVLRKLFTIIEGEM